MSYKKTDAWCDEWTDFQNIIADIFENTVYDENGRVTDEENHGCYLTLINGPQQYEVEDQMMKYLEEHPNATLKELEDHFCNICPEGYPPCASEWDDEDDE